MLNRFSSGSNRPWFKTGIAFLCLYAAALLAGCDDSGGTPTVTTLAGTVTGTYTIPQGPRDSDSSYILTGMGTVAPLGQVQASGIISTSGGVSGFESTAPLTLTNSGGSITLALVGFSQANVGPPPTTFHYTVAGTTGTASIGSGQSINNSGNITLALAPGTPAGSGQFTITFGP